MKKTMIAIMLILIFTTTANATQQFKATGYYPPPPEGYASKAEALMEGGALDCQGNKLQTLQDYKEGGYVSVAVDPRKVKLGTIFYILEIPNVVFVACDRGKLIRGKKIDICCKSKQHTYSLPSKVTIITEKELIGETMIVGKPKKNKKVAKI